MNIEDNWFSKAMFYKIFAQNQTQSLNKPANAEFTNLFATVLNNLISENGDGQTSNSLGSFSQPQAYLSPMLSNNIAPLGTNDEGSEVSAGSLRFQSIAPEELNKVLSGKLTGKGETFVRAGEWYNINPALLVAVSQHETGNGTSNAANEKNNIAGMMGVNGLKSYSSVEESIMDMARNLSKNYLGKGLTTVPMIAKKYAPIGADNDPTNLNKNWVSGVTKYFNQILA